MNNDKLTIDLPIVTIGVASYNNASFIIETLDSVIRQSYPKIELIIVDDCSTDNSTELIKYWMNTCCKEAKLIQHEQNHGICRAANEVLEVAQGKYFMILGSDDILLEEKIISQVTQLEQLGDDYALSYSNVYMINEIGELIEEDFHNKHFKKIQGEAFEMLLKQNFIQAPSTLYVTEAVRKVGGYDENLSFEDLDMLLRLTRKYKISFNEYTNAKYRRISTSMSNKFSVKHLESLLLLLEKHYGVSLEIDSIINGYMQKNAEIVYREGGLNAAHWLKICWQITGGIKAKMLYIMASLNIPYKIIPLFNQMKMLFRF